jgi:anti-anti-sigma regulatory factor
VTVQCQTDRDPDVEAAPQTVTVRPGELSADELQQLRRVLHALVTTGTRTVIVDLTQISQTRRTNVIAVLVGAARDARATGSTLLVHNAPADGRRALFVAGITELDDAAELDAVDYEIVVGTTTARGEQLAV